MYFKATVCSHLDLSWLFSKEFPIYLYSYCFINTNVTGNYFYIHDNPIIGKIYMENRPRPRYDKNFKRRIVV